MAVWDTGPDFHGTRADLQVGDLLTAGFRSNYDGDVVMNHIYFTAWPKGAGLAAEIAKGDGRCRVYIVEPTGPSRTTPTSPTRSFLATPHARTAAGSRCVSSENSRRGNSSMRSTSSSSGSAYAKAWEKSSTESRLRHAICEGRGESPCGDTIAMT